MLSPVALRCDRRDYYVRDFRSVGGGIEHSCQGLGTDVGGVVDAACAVEEEHGGAGTGARNGRDEEPVR